MPPNFPPKTLPIMRHLAALSTRDGPSDQARLTALLDELFAAYWVRHEETQAPEVLRQVITGVLGEEAERELAGAAKDEGKAALQANTDEAHEDGGFGLPWMICEDGEGRRESFWGVDHLGQVAAFLGLEKPETKGWKSML